MYNICKNLELILYKSRAQTRLHGQIITAIIYQTKSAWTKHDANESTGQKWCWKKLSSVQEENIKILNIKTSENGIKIKNPTKERYNQLAWTTRVYNQSVKIPQDEDTLCKEIFFYSKGLFNYALYHISTPIRWTSLWTVYLYIWDFW